MQQKYLHNFMRFVHSRKNITFVLLHYIILTFFGNQPNLRTTRSPRLPRHLFWCSFFSANSSCKITNVMIGNTRADRSRWTVNILTHFLDLLRYYRLLHLSLPYGFLLSKELRRSISDGQTNGGGGKPRQSSGVINHYPLGVIIW